MPFFSQPQETQEAGSTSHSLFRFHPWVIHLSASLRWWHSSTQFSLVTIKNQSSMQQSTVRMIFEALFCWPCSTSLFLWIDPPVASNALYDRVSVNADLPSAFLWFPTWPLWPSCGALSILGTFHPSFVLVGSSSRNILPPNFTLTTSLPLQDFSPISLS